MYGRKVLQDRAWASEPFLETGVLRGTGGFTDLISTQERDGQRIGWSNFVVLEQGQTQEAEQECGSSLGSIAGGRREGMLLITG